MAQVDTIWVVEQYSARTGDYYVLKPFVVEGQMITFLNSLPFAESSRCRVLKFVEGCESSKITVKELLNK